MWGICHSEEAKPTKNLGGGASRKRQNRETWRAGPVRRREGWIGARDAVAPHNLLDGQGHIACEGRRGAVEVVKHEERVPDFSVFHVPHRRGISYTGAGGSAR